MNMYNIWRLFQKFVIKFTNRRLYKHWGEGSYIQNPLLITNKNFIYIGSNVRIFSHARIEAVTKYAGVEFIPHLIINDGVTIQQNVHITCAKSVEIGKNTAIVANVTITDIIHPYTAKDEHLINQPLIVKPVKIGEYCGIYNNVVINAGVTIGKHVTVGANSVVTHDLPDYCVAVGNPARVIKKYDVHKNIWIKI